MRSVVLLLAASASVVALPALAAIPVEDSAQLTEHARTASTTVKLVPIITERENANHGVHCAVTTGRKASITDPTVKPKEGAGSQTIRAYAPDLPATSDPAAKGAASNIEMLFKSSGDVVAGIDASRSALAAARSGFKAAAQQAGTAPTVMAAIDMNSAARLQNGLAWNNVITSANLWVTALNALNALNLATTSDTSRAVMAMRASIGESHVGPGTACQMDAARAGTLADLCGTQPGCSITPPGSALAPGCVNSRYVDTDADDVLYLESAENTATSDAAKGNTTLGAADVTAALAAIDANSR
jgi:hypothetical protein